MIESKLVSIIVPVYNAEKYLDKCIDSILNQSYQNLELILVNDGSSDSSEKICKRYAENDSRIIYLKQDNAGPSAARNAGILISRGEYIQFLDADDYLTTDAVEVLVKAMKFSDYVIASYYNLEQGFLGELDNLVVSKLSGLYSKSDLLEQWGILVEEEMFHYTWNKLYKSEFIRNKLSFNVDIKISEDMIFNIEYLSSSIKTINIINRPIYYHILYNLNSITKSYHQGLFEMRKTTHRCIENFLEINNVYQGNNFRVAKSLFAKRIKSILIHLVSKDTKISAIEKKNIIHYVVNDYDVQSAIGYLDKRLLSKLTAYLIKQKRVALLFYIYLLRDKVRTVVRYFKKKKL